MVLGDGDSAQTILDYRLRELVITRGEEVVKAVPYVSVHAGDTYQYKALPFTLHVLRTCFPCAARARSQAGGNLRGVAAKLELADAPYSKEDAQNLPGMELAVSGAGAADGTYVVFEGLAEPESLTISGSRYTFALRPASRPLPLQRPPPALRQVGLSRHRRGTRLPLGRHGQGRHAYVEHRHRDEPAPAL